MSDEDMAFSDFWQYLTGPRLYRIFKFRDSSGRPYVGNSVETMADSAIKFTSMMRSLLIYSSPLVLTILYRKGLIASEYNYIVFSNSFLRTATAFTFLYIGVILIRGIGRSTNTDYRSFARVLRDAKQQDLSRLSLNKFDFEFNQWPIDFRWYEAKMNDPKKPPQLLSPGRQSRQQLFFSIPCDLISYIVVHTIGRRMIFPGSVSLIHFAVHNQLLEGRAKLVEQNSAERYKLLARDGNQIDCMFVDRRGRPNERAKTLVITSEGNCGFYEVGIMCTPLEAGYSVLGWNHPGFGSSTGLPYPQNVINAIDVVIQFAVERLGFPIDSILLFGWSIGGFPSTWAAMQYPDVKGVLLDASFDDILPLAEAKMPSVLQPILKNVIRSYFNLNCSANLNHFNGAVLLIRRTKDEIIHTNDLEPLRTNRGNDILVKLFHNRFPHLMADEKVKKTLMDWIVGDHRVRLQLEREYNVSEVLCLSDLRLYMESTGAAQYPLKIGDDPQMSSTEKAKLIIFLATKHFKDYDSTHCTPLPPLHFEEPFNLFAIRKTNSNL